MDNIKNKTDGEQIKRFKEAARELDCDEDEARFDDTVKKLAMQKPKDKMETDK